MALLFADRFLLFPDQYVVGDRRSLFWPVYVWKVLYPDPNSRNRPNIFQMSVLKFAHTKLTDVNEISNLMGLTPELIIRIIGELQNEKWLNIKGTITDIGRDYLNEIGSSNENDKVGYIFQDAISGELFPRFTDKLYEIEPISTNNGSPEFLLDRSRGVTDRPLSINPSAKTTSDISPSNIIETYKRYLVDYENAKIIYGSDAPNLDDNISIECIDAAPVPMFLWCWIYKDESSAQSWLASDPFGLRRASPWMRENIINIALKQEGVAKRLSGLLKLPRDKKITAESLDEMDEQVKWDILSKYPWVSKNEQFERYIPALVRQKTFVDSRENPSDEQIDSLLSEAQKLAEVSFQWFLKQWPANNNELRRLPDSWNRSEAYSALTGLNIQSLNSSTMNTLAGQNAKSVKNALRGSNESMKALLFASLLTTVSHAEHPLKSSHIGSQDFGQLLRLAGMRNDANHASGNRFNKTDALMNADFVLAWINKFKEWY